MTDKSKILDRIVKLFALGGSGSNTTEAEMMSAVTKARQLMVEHNLTMADIDGIKDKATAERVAHNINATHAYTRKIRDLARYDLIVGQAVEKLFDVKLVYYSGRSALNGGYSRIRFVGTEIDAAIAVQVFHIILTAVRKAARSTFGKSTWSANHEAYAIGYAERIRRRAYDLADARQSDTLALVLYSKKHAIDKFMAAVKYDTTIKSRKPQDLNSTAYALGYADGGDYNLDFGKVVESAS